MADILVKGHKCERCGYQWVPAKEQRPRTCAKCKSPYWDVPRRGVVYRIPKDEVLWQVPETPPPPPPS